MELRVKKHQEKAYKQSIVQKDVENSECEKKANVLFEKLFGK